MLSIRVIVAAAVCVAAHAAWQLVWEDEFEGSALNASVWSVADNYTHGSSEKELYLAEDVSVASSNLVIRTRFNPTAYGSRVYNYTSGWVTTARKLNFTYGRFEFDAKLPTPAAECTWPALWLVDDIDHCWPTGGEIDVMEEYGANSTAMQSKGTYHWGAQCGVDEWDKYNQAYPNATDGQPPIDFSAAYHTFAVEWGTSSIVWSVDNVTFVTRTVGQPSSLFMPAWPLFIIINTAVSYFGPQCDHAGQPDPWGYPAYFYVDAVRVYEQV